MSAPPPGRRLLYALAPLALLLGGAELGLRATGYDPVTAEDRQLTATFYEGAYLRRRDRDQGPWLLREGEDAVSNPAYEARGLHRLRIPVDPGEARRWFALGGSTTQGAPFEHLGRGFPERLEARLGPPFEVHNLGVGGLDSATYGELLDAVLPLGPEGVLVYGGHNELRGRLLQTCADPARLGLQRAFFALRTAVALRQGWRALAGDPPPLDLEALQTGQQDCMDREVRAVLAAEDPPSEGARRDAHHAWMLATWRENLGRLVARAEEAGLRVVLGVPATNPTTRPSWRSEPPGLDPEAARTHREALDAAIRHLEAGRWEEALVPAEQAWRLAPDSAESAWALGLARWRTAPDAAGRREALALLDRAEALDFTGARAPPAVREAVRELCAADPSLRCVDLDAAIRGRLLAGEPEALYFTDHCHLSREAGYALASEAFAEAIAR